MNLTITNDTCEDIIFNGNYLEKLYFGNDLVWEKKHDHDYSLDYFTITSLEDDNAISLECDVTFTSSTYMKALPDVYWSTDRGANWSHVNLVSSSGYRKNPVQIATLNTNDQILIKANGPWTYINSDVGSGAKQYIITSKTIDISGNSMSLIYGDNFIGNTSLLDHSMWGSNYYVGNIYFSKNMKAVHAHNLILPAIDLTNHPDAYSNLFYNFNLLVTPPALPATTLSDSCYKMMFRQCTSLVNAPDLPATTLSNSCYKMMFYRCTSLVNAPDLPATTLSDNCYEKMFSGCSNLNYIKCLATNISASDCLYNWLYNIAASGTFVKKTTMSSWPTGTSGIPSGWTVQNANS